jgi:muramoyltetrapeptide carboxypeptidase LdcA involved in peptidoglycan recycling
VEGRQHARPEFKYPPKPARGDAVAVVSPSGRSPAAFPLPFELGLRRLRDELGLHAVEYPTTRAAVASPAERARDLHAAFADPEIKALIATIGGEDELRVLAHLDRELIAANPKPFFGYSDNTNLHLFLWSLGLVSYHGGAVMVQLGRAGSMHPLTRRSLEKALFTRESCEVEPASGCSDEDVDWTDSATLEQEPPMFGSDPWSWHGPSSSVTGPAWGGSLEIVDFHLRVGRYLLDNEAYEGAILFLETSEELPPASYVYRVLMCMGERGLLQRFAAILWARPKAWSFEQPNAEEEKARHIECQREAVLAAHAEYHPGVPLVFGVEFGHTDPQYVIPSGGEVVVDAAGKRLSVSY